MKFAIDRIEDEIVVLENLETKEIINAPLSSFNDGIHEGSIIEYIDGEYKENKNLEEERLNLIRDKFDKLKNKNS